MIKYLPRTQVANSRGMGRDSTEIVNFLLKNEKCVPTNQICSNQIQKKNIRVIRSYFVENPGALNFDWNKKKGGGSLTVTKSVKKKWHLLLSFQIKKKKCRAVTFDCFCSGSSSVIGLFFFLLEYDRGHFSLIGHKRKHHILREGGSVVCCLCDLWGRMASPLQMAHITWCVCARERRKRWEKEMEMMKTWKKRRETSPSFSHYL